MWFIASHYGSRANVGKRRKREKMLLFGRIRDWLSHVLGLGLLGAGEVDLADSLDLRSEALLCQSDELEHDRGPSVDQGDILVFRRCRSALVGVDADQEGTGLRVGLLEGLPLTVEAVALGAPATVSGHPLHVVRDADDHVELRALAVRLANERTDVGSATTVGRESLGEGQDAVRLVEAEVVHRGVERHDLDAGALLEECRSEDGRDVDVTGLRLASDRRGHRARGVHADEDATLDLRYVHERELQGLSESADDAVVRIASFHVGLESLEVAERQDLRELDALLVRQLGHDERHVLVVLQHAVARQRVQVAEQREVRHLVHDEDPGGRVRLDDAGRDLVGNATVLDQLADLVLRRGLLELLERRDLRQGLALELTLDDPAEDRLLAVVLRDRARDTDDVTEAEALLTGFQRVLDCVVLREAVEPHVDRSLQTLSETLADASTAGPLDERCQIVWGADRLSERVVEVSAVLLSCGRQVDQTDDRSQSNTSNIPCVDNRLRKEFRVGCKDRTEGFIRLLRQLVLADIESVADGV